ncbi:MAG: ABC transporter permease [Longimicrobiales bacterium]
MDTLIRDLRYGTRMLRKEPGAAVISILALGLGIGLTTMMFSIIYGALLRGLPVPERHEVVHVERTNLSEGIESMEVTIHDLADWKEQQRSFEALGGMYSGTVNISGTEGPERYDGAFMNAAVFQILGVQPVLGRLFTAEEDRPDGPPVVVIGHNVWRDRYASDPDIIGKTAKVMGRVSTIIGVMPEGFHFPINEELWVPLAMDPLRVERGQGTTLEVFGRLRDGVTIEQANLDLNAIAQRLASAYPETNEGVGVVTKPVMNEFIGPEPRAMLYTMLGAVFLILVIACANVANLLLSRAAVRSKEVGVRAALGAGRWRLVMQFLAEAFMLALGGALLGIGVAGVGILLFNRSIADTQPPYWIDIRLDPLALGVVMLLTLIAALGAGCLPALQAAKADVNEILKDEARGSSSFRLGRVSKGLVVAEIALSCGLLTAAGLMIKSITKLRNVDYAFATTDVLTARVGLPEPDYPDSAGQIAFFEELLPRIRAIPGVHSAALTTSLPGLNSGFGPVAIEGVAYAAERDYPGARNALISPGFFGTFDVDLLQGRDFSIQDRAGTLPVAIVNRSFVEVHFAGENPLGRRIRFGVDEPGPWRTIVGVAPDLHMGGAQNEEPQGAYIPTAQAPARFMSIAARTRAAPLSITPQVRAAVRSVDDDLPIYFVETLNVAIARSNWHYGVFGGLFMVFGFVALFLGAVGLYGVMSFSVSRRTREMGVRMALGAEARDVLRLILRQGMLQLAVGLAFGVLIAFGLARLLTILLFGVKPYDPAVFASIIVVLGAAALAACMVPALRATRVTPIEALRTE